MPTRVYLSGVTSVAHLVHAGAYLQHLLDEGAEVTLVLLAPSRFLGRRVVDDEDVAALLPDDPRLTVTTADRAGLRAAAGERLVYLAVAAPGIKPLLRLHVANPGRRLRRVAVDEGLGSYGDLRTLYAAGRRQRRAAPLAAVRAAAAAFSRRFLVQDRWSLYRRDRRGFRGWRVDPRVADRFAALLARERAAAIPGSVEPATRVVWLSQPWVELGQVDERRYAELVRAVAAAARSAGLHLVVRPHPAEDVARFAGLALTPRRGPAELDPDVVDAAAVVGVTSTALVNLAALYGCTALRVEVPELAHLEQGLSRLQRSLLAAFLPPPVPVSALSARLAAEAGGAARVTRPR